MSEHQLQCAVAQWLDLKRWLWCAVPNGGKRSAITGAMLKKEGAKRGVPDILIFEKWPGGFGVAIEMKFGKGRTSKVQDHWLAELRRRGWKVAVCRSLDEVILACEVL